MGCWNGTCMVSNLPIRQSEKVKLIILKNKGENLNVSGTCHSTDIMEPAFFPISGVYNDYGSIENIIEDLNYHYIDNYFKNKYFKIKADDEEVETSLESIIEGIERGNSYSQMQVIVKEGGKWENANYAFVFIREDIWNYIIDNHIGEYWNQNDEEVKKGIHRVSAETYFNYLYNTLISEIQHNNTIVDDRERMLANFGTNDKMRAFFTGNGESRPRLECFYDYVELLLEAVKNNDEEKIKEIYKISFELSVVHDFLETIRKPWMIQAGAGSQQSEWDSYKGLAEKIIDICNRSGELYDEYED